MASWIHTRLWVLVGILLAFGCQRYDDQPDANPVPAPALGDITIQLNDSGKGDLPTPLVKDLRDGALTLHLTKPRHGEIVADLLAGRVIYTAHDDFRGTDTANYTLKRGNSTTGGLVLVKVAERSCLVIANEDVINLDVPVSTNYNLKSLLLQNDVFCPGARVEVIQSLNLVVRNDDGEILLNTPPAFVGSIHGEYEIVSYNGHRSRAGFTINVRPCTTPLVAHDDDLRFDFPIFNAFWSVSDLIANDQKCPDSVNLSSIEITMPDRTDTLSYLVKLDPESDPLNPKLKIRLIPVDSTIRDYYFTYKVWTKSRRQYSSANVRIHR
ncbi:hypothetical protein WDZ92_00485 [Nostoc sp. NIES-2111]